MNIKLKQNQRLNAFVGTDGQGDDCLYIQVVKEEDGDLRHVRYLNGDELTSLIEQLTQLDLFVEND